MVKSDIEIAQETELEHIRDIAKKIEQVFRKSGITIHVSYDIKDKDLSSYSKILLCVGRKVNLDDLFDPNLGMEISEEGLIKVDNYLKKQISQFLIASSKE